MEGQAQPFSAADVASALDWWREAGVEYDYSAQPVRWLAPDEPVLRAPEVPPAYSARPEPGAERSTADASAEPVGGDRANWPGDLESFARWWLEHPSLDGGQVRGRIAPRGPKGAELMVVLAQPEPDDRESLLEGPAGTLLEAILAALGIAPDAVYLSSALPRHTPGADWPALQAAGLGALLAHHAGLVAPERMILFGAHVLPLLGHDPAQIAQTSLAFNHEGRTIPLLAAQDLGVLATRPARKAALWRRLLDFAEPGVLGSKLDGTA